MQRRSLLQGLALAPLAGACPRAEAKSLDAVAVEGLEIFRVHVNKRGGWVIARLNTNKGLTGLGDASHGGNDDETVQYQAPVDLLKGRSIFDVAWLRRATISAQGQNAAVAASALEHALWDLQGKAWAFRPMNCSAGAFSRAYGFTPTSTPSDPRTGRLRGDGGAGCC